MNSIILRSLYGITPASIEKYLLFSGWQRDRNFANPKLWVYFKNEDPNFRIAVPGNQNAKDYFHKIYDIVLTLSEYQNISLEEIIASVKSAYTDRIQFRIIADATKEGKLPLSYASQCIEGLRDLVLYSACAEENAKPLCARTYNSARNRLEKFQFDQTGHGSFVFNIDVQVAEEENEQEYLLDVAPAIPEPPEHRIVKRIQTSIEQVNSVVNQSVRVGDLIETAYQDGLTANICDALYKLKPDGVEDFSVETTFHFAKAITQSNDEPSRSTLENIHFSFFDEISKRYKDRTLIEDIELRGTIKMLSKDNHPDTNEIENTVKLLTRVDGQMRSITVHLSAADHTAACNAYRDDKEVEIAGVLDKSQSRWFFSEVTRFSVID